MSAVPVTSVNLQDLQLYAQTYFPESFSKLPSINALSFEPYLPAEIHERHGHFFAHGRLRFGHRAGSAHGPIRAYVDKKSNSIYYTTGTQRKPRRLHGHNIMPARLWQPFLYSLPSNGSSGQLSLADSRALECLLMYFFMVKGHISHLKGPEVLTIFESVCKSIAAKNNIVDSSNRGVQDDQAAKKFYACLQKRDAQSLASESSNKTARVISTNPTSLKRPASAIADTDRETEVRSRPKTMHMDLIRKAIQEREAEAYRPVEELNALKSRITELESNITQRDSLKKELQAQYAQEKARRLKSENDLKSAVADLSRERVSSKKQVELIKVQQNQIEKARNLEATLVKEKAKNTANNSKLEKAKALYDTHKETINLVCGKGNDAIKKRKNVLSAFEREFGELVNGGKSIGG